MQTLSKLQGNRWVILGLIVLFAVVELNRAWVFASYDPQRYPMPSPFFWVVSALLFSFGIVFWCLLARVYAKNVTAEPPDRSKFVELYLLTSLVITALVIYRVFELQTSGHLAFAGPFEWLLVTKGTHLVLFWVMTYRLVRSLARKPAPLISPGRGGLV